MKGEHSAPRYFGALTPELEDHVQNKGKEQIKEKIYIEIRKQEAQISLRLEGSGGERVGDGEIWNKVPGVEKIWCEKCQVWWEFRAWVREI